MAVRQSLRDSDERLNQWNDELNEAISEALDDRSTLLQALEREATFLSRDPHRGSSASLSRRRRGVARWGVCLGLSAPLSPTSPTLREPSARTTTTSRVRPWGRSESFLSPKRAVSHSLVRRPLPRTGRTRSTPSTRKTPRSIEASLTRSRCLLRGPSCPRRLPSRGRREPPRRPRKERNTGAARVSCSKIHGPPNSHLRRDRPRPPRARAGIARRQGRCIRRVCFCCIALLY